MNYSSPLIPQVSILMSVYNGSQYLREAIDSILNQTFTNFEFIIIDDCSTDSSREILTNFANQDSRIILIKNQENCGLTKSLNKGLEIAKGKYIARQDDDDVSCFDRLNKQVSYMNSHPLVTFISTGVDYIDQKGNFLHSYIPEVDPLALRLNFFFKNPIRHSTVLWRHKLVSQEVGNYNPSFTYSQDYELWVRIAEKFSIATLPEALVKIRWHKKSISETKLEQQDAFATLVTHRQVKHYFPDENISTEDAANMRAMFRVKHKLEQERFANLKVIKFEQYAFICLQLWKKFFEKLSVDSAAALQIGYKEVEINLFSWLKHCHYQQWLLVGSKVVVFYLINFPNRLFPFTLTILRKLG